MLVDFWRNQKPEDPLTLNACWQLADRVLANLAPDHAKRVQRSPRHHRDTIATELNRLVEHDPIALSLVNSLVHGFAPTESGAFGRRSSITVHGDHNQIAWGSGTGVVNQVMHISSGSATQPTTLEVRSELEAPLVKVQLTQRSSTLMEVRLLEASAMGEARLELKLPYTDNDLVAVLKAIAMDQLNTRAFTTPQLEALERLGLRREPPLDRRRLLRAVGRTLYESVFVGVIGEALRATQNRPRPSGTAVHLQLCFDADTVTLARYPWELLHDDSHHLVQGGLVELTRYVAYPKSVPTFSLTHPLHVLYVAPRPRSLPYLPADDDLTHMRTALGDLERAGQIQIERLAPPTLRTLVTYLTDRIVDVLHFDGHGTFARECPHCHARNYPHLTICAECQSNIADIEPEGFLGFENDQGEVEWVDSSTLGSLLSNRSLQIAVMLACSSGMVRGDTLFTGIGPALINAGVPAVIASQADIESTSATIFTQGFYRTLAQGAAIPTAVNAGRALLLSERTWYLPALYVRSRPASASRGTA